ncbi:MAG: hypothetical protein AAGG69_13260, partial [Pseudomonadota bacterium]
RDELLDRVMNNYRRFYGKKALFHYPWRGTGYRRRYLLGCLKAFLKAGFQRKFYDLGKAGYWGPQSKGKLDFHFDDTKKIAQAQLDDWSAIHDKKVALQEARKKIEANEADVPMACGGDKEQMEDYSGLPTSTRRPPRVKLPTDRFRTPAE